MQEHERRIRPALAAIVLICFFMPFIKISCAGHPLVSITGLDLVTGKIIEPPGFLRENPGYQGFADGNRPELSADADPASGDGQPQSADPSYSIDQPAGRDPSNPFDQAGNGEMKIDTEPFMAAAMFLAVLALLTALGASQRAMQMSAVSSGLGAVVLLIFKANAGGDIPTESMGMIELEWTTAFWVALISSAVLALFTARLLSQGFPVRQKPRLVIQSRSDNTRSESLKQ